MADNQITTTGEAPTVEPITYNCELEVESTERLAGTSTEQRITFNGEASPKLLDAIVEAIGQVTGYGRRG